MKKIFFLMAFGLSLLAESQVSLTYLNQWQVTPNTQDSSGVFCRTFYHSARNKYYSIYSGRPHTSGGMQYYRWKEFDANFVETGSNGILNGPISAGDYAVFMVDSNYYHITGYSSWRFLLSKYDDDFNLVDTTTIQMDSSDSQADMMMNYTNGKIIIGAFHQAGVYHPTMPQQQTSWAPIMHKWEYDLNLNPVATPVYLSQVFNTWGSSCIYNSNKYNIVTMSKWPHYNLSVYRYDSTWTYIDSINLNHDGQWSQGVVWDGNNYYVAYHSGHEHRAGNITLAVYDVNWSMVYDTIITNNSQYLFNVSPDTGIVQHNANRPFITKLNDTLIISYDLDDYVLHSFAPPIFQEGNRWQANVIKLKINNNLTTQIHNNEKDVIMFNVYPNPANGYLNTFSNEDGVLQIFNLMGQLVFETNLFKGKQQLNLSQLQANMYMVNFKSKSGKGNFKQKIVIQ